MRKIFTFLTAVLLINQASKAQCNPAFTFSVNQAVVSFTGVVNPPTVRHYWNFGDGFAGAGRITSHTYNTPGTYQVYHMVYDSLGTCSDSLVQTVTVIFTPTCQAFFNTHIDSIDYSDGIYCYSNSTSNGIGIQTYVWKVNGVTQSNNTNTFFLPRVPGVQNICLTITTTNGCTSTYCRSFTIPPFCNLSPSFTHTADPVNPRRISFVPTPNQSNYQYRWQFGDGTTSWQVAPTHIYTHTGIYSVKLTIRDTVSNCVDTVRQNINVGSIPTCTASYTYTLSNSGLGVFLATSNEPISSQTWYISHFATGDTAIIHGNNPSYQFPDTGYYTVCLYVVTNTGCGAWFCRSIHVSNVAGRYEERILSYPNPVNSGTISMNMIIGTDGPMDIKVYDVAGTIVYQSQQQGRTGGNIVRIPVDQLNKGQYFVEICYRYKIKRSIFQKL